MPWDMVTAIASSVTAINTAIIAALIYRDARYWRERRF